jgi:nucleotide-binding universal stress UspA family protein
MSEQERRSGGRPHVVLAAVSFDATGDRALAEAAGIAQHKAHTELHLVHVVADREPGELLALDVRLSGIPGELKKRVESLWMEHARRVVAHIRVGVPARAILQTAADIGADLIIVGTHHRSGLERFVLGSVAERVLRDARCPVLVALPRDYAALAQSSSIEPPCPDCVAAREQSGGERYWCERHAHTRMSPHVYEPSDRGRTSIIP